MISSNSVLLIKGSAPSSQQPSFSFGAQNVGVSAPGNSSSTPTFSFGTTSKTTSSLNQATISSSGSMPSSNFPSTNTANVTSSFAFGGSATVPSSNTRTSISTALPQSMQSSSSSSAAFGFPTAGANKIKCPTCLVQNDSTASKCISCESPLASVGKAPDTLSSNQASSSGFKAFTNTAPNSGAFRFGNSGANSASSSTTSNSVGLGTGKPSSSAQFV
jgi:hypothetical protein